MKYTPELAVLRPALALALMSITTITIAAKPDDITATEMAMIPAYCPYTQSFGQYPYSFGSKQWASRMGSTFSAMHHYCWGQINVQRALRSGTPAHTKRHLLTMSRDDYLYAIRNATHDFVLLPELLTRLGEVELRLSNPNAANKSFAQARALRQDYWPAYSQWAEFLIYSGQRQEAKQLVKSGLEYSPTSRVLQVQYRLLGGNPSDIVPRAREEAPEDSIEETDTPPLAEQPSPTSNTPAVSSGESQGK